MTTSNNSMMIGLRGTGMRKIALALGLSLTALSALAQNAIQSLTGGVQSGSEVIRIETSEALSVVPTGFTIQAPARIALDFPGVINAMGRSTVEINQGNLRSANVVQAGDRTRVVINLKQPAAYQARLDGKSVLLVMDRVQVAGARPAASTVFAEASTHGSKEKIWSWIFSGARFQKGFAASWM